MPLTYDQSEYEMAGALQGSPYRIAQTSLTGMDVPWGSEVVLEGEILAGEREIEGPFGEFTGHYSGGRKQPVIKVHKVSHRPDPIFEHLYLGMPWTEMDYTLVLNTNVPLHQQLKAKFPEVQAVNAMYTQGLLAVVSVKQRYGGFAKGVGMRAMPTPHGLGYCKVVIVVDETVDPFNLAPGDVGAVGQVPPASRHRDSAQRLGAAARPELGTGRHHRQGRSRRHHAHRPETRGHYSQTVDEPDGTRKWEDIIKELFQ